MIRPAVALTATFLALASLLDDDFVSELECTHCGGDGECDANADPLWDCDDNPHPCHACGGTGLRRDQTIF